MTAADPVPPAKPSRLPLILGLVLGLAGAGGGFMATRMGLLSPAAADDSHAAEGDHAAPAEEHAAEGDHGDEGAAASGAGEFVPLDPLVVNVDDPDGGRFLRFVAQIEAEPGHAAEIEAIKPRFSDVLNGYLRAVELADLENPQALDLLRGQMLRRLQTVAGDGVIRDLLIVEFVLN
jgi:flagellar FliL protein